MSDLKPCPFCGGTAELFRTEGCDIIAGCTECGAQNGYSFEEDEEAAIKAWNNRPYENKIKAEAVREAHDKILTTLQEQYTTPDAHSYEVLGMLSLHADKLEGGEITNTSEQNTNNQ